MIQDIYDFLPKYPNVNNTDIEFLNPYEDDFYTALFKKKEFYDERLEKAEDFPKEKGDLLKHQKIVARFFSSHTPYDRLLLLHQMGTGKCHKINTPILLHNGTIKMVQDIKVGDFLMGDDSTPREVTSLARGVDDMYDIIPIKGDKFTVNKEHILCLKMSGYPYYHCNDNIHNTNYSIQWLENNKFCSKTFTFNSNNKEQKEFETKEFLKTITNEQILEISVKDFLKLSKIKQNTLKVYRVPVEFSEKEVFDPYIIGYWLGDRHSCKSSITTQDSTVINYFKNNLDKYNLSLNYISHYDYGISGFTGKIDSNIFLNELKRYKLINNKHIPYVYKCNSRENRLKLLAGLIDSDGHLDKSGIFEFTQTNEILMNDVIYLCRSLGFACYKHKKKTSWTYKGIKKIGEAWRICISGKDIEQIPTLIPRKRASIRKQIKDVLVSSISVKHVGKDNYYGFTLDGNNRYLMGDFTVTHNTAAAIGSIELIKSENSTFTGAMIFARGEGLLNNFKNELVFEATKGQYKPANYEHITEGEKVARINKLVKEYYTFNFFNGKVISPTTFFQFAKYLSNMPDKVIIELYSNKIIIIDEVHNIRIKDVEKNEEVYVYKEFHRFLHLVKNCKILLLSGTPIKDTIDEFANIMNLILPMDEQFSTQKEFLDEYFNQDGELYKIKPNKIKKMKHKLKGRVSYLKAIRSDIKRVFIGQKNVGSLKHFIVYKNFMSSFQSKYYLRVYEKEKVDKKSAFNIESREASLFIFPDKTFGTNGFANPKSGVNKIKNDNNIVTKTQTVKAKRGDKIVKKTYYALSDKLKSLLLGSNNIETLNNLKKYSIIYYSAIKNILKSAKEGKSQFVYCEYVFGGGSILFALILELFGFAKATPVENTKKLRYALINNEELSSQKEFHALKDRFNKPDNLHGEYINLIIGSKVITEGFSLKNVQVEYIFTPHWNYSETDQAEARGFRFGSHQDLINAGITPKLEIYQYVSIPINGEEKLYNASIDLKMYELSEIKDINIKQIERLIKESAFDCALTYKRNYVPGYDNERECEYTDCNYSCDGVPEELYKTDKENKEESDSEEEISIEDIIINELREMGTYSEIQGTYGNMKKIREVVFENLVEKDLVNEDFDIDDYKDLIKNELEKMYEEEPEEESEDESNEESESNEEESNEDSDEEFELDEEEMMEYEEQFGTEEHEYEKDEKDLSEDESEDENTFKMGDYIMISDDKLQWGVIVTKDKNKYVAKLLNGKLYNFDSTAKNIIQIRKGEYEYEKKRNNRDNDFEKWKKNFYKKNKTEYSSEYEEESEEEYEEEYEEAFFGEQEYQKPKNKGNATDRDCKNCRIILNQENIHSKSDYKKWILKNHPDKLIGKSEEIIKKAQNRVKLVIPCYNIYYGDDIKCTDGGDSDDIEIDKSTYELYYNKDKIDKLTNEIINLFNKYYFKINLDVILNRFLKDYTSFEVITVLRNIINRNIIIHNKYGFPNYLKESNNIYFLVDNLTVESNYYSEYYTQNPIVEVKSSFMKIINEIYMKAAPKIIKKLFKLTNIEKMKFIINKLSPDILEIILENSIIANEKGVIVNKTQRDLILSIFKNDYKKITVDEETIFISSLLFESKKIYKCLELSKLEEGWKKCNEEYVTEYRKDIVEKKKQVKENIYGGYYGLFNKSGNEEYFCIKSPETEEEKKNKSYSKIKTGQVCGTADWVKKNLINLVVDIFKVPIPPSSIPDSELKYNKKLHLEIKNLSIKNMRDKILEKKEYVKYTKSELKTFSDDDIKRIYYWSHQQVKSMCGFLKEWLDNEGLLVYDPNCGKQNKKKKEFKELD